MLKVVYMDEPSTGLDPASRKNLWTVIQRAKQDTAIILTSTSISISCFTNYSSADNYHQIRMDIF